MRIMKKVKRRSTKKVVQDAPQSDLGAIKVKSNGILPIEQADILPLSLRMQLEAGTRARVRAHLPDNLKERTEAMIRRFKGDRLR